MIKELLRESTVLMAQVHDYLLRLNDIFSLHLDDKQLHFIVMAAIGMLLFFAVHFIFKRLARFSISAISFIYVFTVMTVLGFAIEIGQRVTGTGNMDFGDVAAGLYGVLAFFGVYVAYKLVAFVLKKIFHRR